MVWSEVDGLQTSFSSVSNIKPAVSHGGSRIAGLHVKDATGSIKEDPTRFPFPVSLSHFTLHIIPLHQKKQDFPILNQAGASFLYYMQMNDDPKKNVNIL